MYGTGLFLAVFSFLFLCMDRVVGAYDEGIILTASMLVGSDQFIHRDFYANYGPGEFYLLAWLFEVFGQKIMVERCLDLAMRSGILVMLYFAARRHAGKWIALTMAALCALWLAMVGNYGYPVYPALLLAIGSTLLVVRACTDAASPLGASCAGILAGTVVLFRYDIGFFTLVAHVLTVAVLCLGLRHLSPAARVMWRSGAAYALGFILVTGSMAVCYALHGALPGFLHDVVTFPAKHYAATRALPFPGIPATSKLETLSCLSIYLPPMLFLAVLVAGIDRQRWRASARMPRSAGSAASDGEVILIVAFTMLSALFYCKGMVRVSIEHMQLSLIPAMLALSVCVARANHAQHRLRFVFAGLLALAVCAALATAMLRLGKASRVIDDTAWLAGYASGAHDFVVEKTPAQRLAHRIVQPLLLVAADRDAALDYLVCNGGSLRHTFFGLKQHDRIFINDVSAYFLTHKMPVTKWHHFDPALQNSIEIQGQMIAGLERFKPAYIWIESTWDLVKEPNASAHSSHVKMLDAYIGAHYEPARQFGKIEILRRKI
jgi:hypothetical protein